MTPECIDDEDEVLLVLAEELANLTDHLGDREYTYYLLEPLENIAAVEESSVREKVSTMLQQDAGRYKLTWCFWIGCCITLQVGGYSSSQSCRTVFPSISKEIELG